MRARLAAVLAILLGYGVLQAVWLPPDGVFSGDIGTKYLQARAVTRHGPLSPWIDGPALEIDTARRWQDPFLVPREDGRLVGVFSWLLAALTAPFLYAFGLHGLYVVPAVSVAVAFLAISSMGRALGQPGGGTWAGWCAVLATPLLFYGAELWEHAPAVALVSVAGALLIGRGSNVSPRRSFGAAVCLVLASALRPESLVAVPALAMLFASVWGWREATRGAVAFALGGAVAAAAIAAINHAVFGAVIPQQVSSNLQAGFPYLAMRAEAFQSIVIGHANPLLLSAGLAMLAGSRFVRADRARTLLANAGFMVMLSGCVAVALWRTLVAGRPWLHSFEAASLAQAWPLILILAWYVPMRAPDIRERALVVAAAMVIVLVFVTLPHTGGSQWGGRFFLPVVPFIALLAVERVRASATRAATALVIVLSIGVQVYGLAYLRQNKRITAQITRITASLTAPGDLIASDLFWYPQVTATLYPTRRMLFAKSPSDFDAIATAAAEHGLRSLWIAASTDITGYSPPGLLPAGPGRAPFVRGFRRAAGQRSLLFYWYERP